MEVSPNEETRIAGDKGEVPARETTYEIKAIGGNVSWAAAADLPWLTVSTLTGVATEAKPSRVRIEVNPQAKLLRLGRHVARITFTNLINGSGDTIRRVALDVTVDKFLSSSPIPSIRASYRPKLLEAANRLAYRLQGELEAKDRTEEIPWSIAQMAVALHGRTQLDDADLQKFIRSKIDPRAHAWRQFPEDIKGPIHVGASAWVIFALALFGQRAEAEELRFLLRQQAPDGWWAIYPTKHQEQNASVYATAWCLLALTVQSTSHMVPSTMQAAVDTAIKNGRAWLLKTRGLGVAHKAHWKNYPFRVNFTESLSASALALHTLHRLLDAADLVEVDRSWLADVPETIPTAVDKEESLDATIEIESGRTDKDKVRLYKLPWMIVATVDAYPNGRREEQARAFDWLDEYLGRPGQLDDELSGEGNWVAAEVLIGLRHLLGEKVLR